MVPILFLMTLICLSYFNVNGYGRYSYYPPYCSTADEMATRAVPSLSSQGSNDATSRTRLVHVTSIVRHGARTPYSKHKCWKGYWHDPETSVWDCNLTAVIGLTTRKDEQKLEHYGTNIQNEGTSFTFQKKYDALINHGLDQGVQNLLHGTCEAGQLLLQGYDQEYANGRHIREAYAFNDEGKSTDSRMNLINISEIVQRRDDSEFWDSLIKYRSDDEQRTVMSGQVFLSGIFDNDATRQNSSSVARPILIPLHTADYSHDIIRANPTVCPRLNDLEHNAKTSKEYDTFHSSPRLKELRTFVMEELEWDLEQRDSFDCLMTTICTDRLLPLIIRNDSDFSDEHSLFHKIFQYVRT